MSAHVGLNADIEATHENSVVFVEVYRLSIAEKTGVGTGYSAMKLPCVSLTLRVTPRLIVCRLLQSLSMPLVDVETVEPGRRPYGGAYTSASRGLRNGESDFKEARRYLYSLRRIKSTRKILANGQRQFFHLVVVIVVRVCRVLSQSRAALVWKSRAAFVGMWH